MNKCVFPVLVLCLCLVASADTFKDEDVRVGSYFADAWNGVSMVAGDKAAFLMRIGWVDSNEKSRHGHFGFKFNNYDGKYTNGDIGQYQHAWGMTTMPIIPHSRPLTVGPAAPDQSYSRLGWKVDAAEVVLEWARVDQGYVARVSADACVRITIEMAPAWEIFKSEYSIVDSGVDGAGIVTGGDDIVFKLRTDKKQDFAVCLDADLTEKLRDKSRELSQQAGQMVVKKHPRIDKKGKVAMLVYDLMPGEAVNISAGIGKLASVKNVGEILSGAEKKYLQKRTWAEGDWGDFVSPISQNLAHTRLYNFKTGDVTYSVSRRWSNYDGVVLFNWDSLFNSLLGNIEDPKTAKNTIRGLLKAQQPSGLLPNYSGPHWGVSTGRSQRPVVGMCVWKIYQRQPDKDFLREVFADLVKANDWWLAERPDDGLPHRDGNRDGLISCGEESGDVGATVYSGLDNSPQWDETTHSRMVTRSFRHEQLDISALWIADAHFLALIADELGEDATAKRLRQGGDKMADAMNKLCWSDVEGMYCNRFWDIESIMPAIPVPQECLLTNDGKAGLTGEYYSGSEFNKLKLTRTDDIIDFAWNDSPAGGIPADNFSVRWKGKVKPAQSGKYIFGARVKNGIRLWVDNKLLIDDWDGNKTPKWASPIGPQNKAAVEPLQLTAAKEYDVRIEFRNITGPAEMIFRWYRCSEDGDGLLSKRIGATNLYPLIGSVPDKKRADRMIDYLKSPRKLWGKYVVPTISRDDPYFNQHDYWRGRIWGPTNYLLYQGLKNYASDDLRYDYAKKSVDLFMKNWVGNGGCWENYHTTGLGGNDPHYTWGALLCLIGLEEICDIEPDGRIRLNGKIDANIYIHNLPINGEHFDVRVSNNKTELLKNNKVVIKAVNSVKRQKFNAKNI